MSKDLYDKLKEYSKSDFYPFHMPGHKRNVNLIKEQYGIDIDITEIDGFDMLYEADVSCMVILSRQSVSSTLCAL